MQDSPTSGQHWDVYARLEDPMGTLSISLEHWATRDDTRPQPWVRRAANDAMDTIDTMLAELHAMRARLVTEIRASDDATAARADKMLAGTAALLGDLNRPADPLVRRLRFEAAHPDVTITAPETHASPWVARQDGKVLATDPQLGGLLDALDWLTGKTP